MPRLNPSSRKSGLTLIEVMVALGVPVILVSGIFMVVQTALKTVILISNRASRDDEITNLVDILRSNFRNLPSRARITAITHSENGVKEHLFIVQNAPGFMSWLPVRGGDHEVVLLSLRQDSAEKRWRVCLKRFEPSAQLANQEANPKTFLKAASHIPWLELVADLERMGVRFLDSHTHQWHDLWKNKQTRPGLIELTLFYEYTADPNSATALIWLPPVKGGAS